MPDEKAAQVPLWGTSACALKEVSLPKWQDDSEGSIVHNEHNLGFHVQLIDRL